MRPAALLLVALSATAAAQTVRTSPSIEDTGAEQVCAVLGTDALCRTQPPQDSTGTYPPGRMSRGGDTWEASYGPFNPDMRLLDVGGTPVLATQWAITNWLSVELWELGILPAAGGPPVATFEMQAFDPDGGSFGTHAGRTVLWATEWLNLPPPGSRSGLSRTAYLYGRPFYLDAGGIVPATDLPIRARSLRTSFEEEPGGPARWLSHRRAMTWRTDPALRGVPRTTRGTVTEATFALNAGGTPALTVTLRTDAGALLVLTSVVWSDGPSFSYLGDGPSGRLFPANYRPADASAWLVGRRVRFETRGADSVLWRE